jgi:hypothetical protein
MHDANKDTKDYYKIRRRKKKECIFVMSSSPPTKRNFVPLASIAAFIFIGVFLIIAAIGRVLALNQSTIRSAQGPDLVIYRAPPRANPPQQRNRPSTDLQ